MKTSVRIHIPKPCHENWHDMTPVAQGRFCAGCNKEVIDFSLFTDAEILNFFKKSTGNTCGRFYAGQLQRTLQETRIEKKKGLRWVLASLASLIMISKTQAQKTDGASALTGKTRLVERTVGETAFKADTSKGIKSIVKKQRLKKPDPTGDIASVLSKPQMITPGRISGNETAARMAPQSLKNLKQPGPLSQCFTGLTGAVVVVTTPTKLAYTRIDPAPGIVRKLMDTLRITSSGFRMYPNPAGRNSLVHVVLKEAGSYQLELYDNDSRLLQAQQNTSSAKNQAVDLQLPTELSAGLYYVRMVNLKTKKAYVDKLIVQ